MKPRFTPALCEYLQGMGFDIHFSKTQDHTLKGEPHVLEIEILDLPEEDIDGYIKEMKTLAKTECTNR